MSANPMLPFPTWEGEDPAARVQRWNQYVATISEAYAASSGFEREKLRSQLEDAEKGRQNALALQQLRDRTSRYGFDLQAQTDAAKLKETARQFDLTHALDQQKLGLSAAQTATEYLSTPDRFFQAADFVNMAGRALGRTTNGAQGPAPYASTGAPTPKTEADWQAFSGGFNPAGGGAASTAYGGPGAGGGGGDVVSAAAGGSDPRAKALKAMLDAVPPSPGMGLDANDYAVLQAAKAMYSTNLAPGTYQKMRPGQRSMFESAGRRLGYDVNDWKAQYQRQGIGQGNPRGAY